MLDTALRVWFLCEKMWGNQGDMMCVYERVNSSPHPLLHTASNHTHPTPDTQALQPTQTPPQPQSRHHPRIRSQAHAHAHSFTHRHALTYSPFLFHRLAITHLCVFTFSSFMA